MTQRKKLILIPLLTLMSLCSLFLLLDFWCPLDLSKVKKQSQQYLSDQGEVIHVTLSKDDMYRMKVDLKDVSPLYLKLLIAREDQRFYDHPGVDFRALLRAAMQCIGKGRIVSGASTLTMQTAKLLEPRPRTFTSKMIEMFRAFQLEWRFSKEDILKIYLNLIPCGGNVEGLKAASYTYFQKSPKHLSVAEASFLVMLPQSPTRLRPDRFPERARLKRDQVLTNFYDQNVINEDEFSYALTEELPHHFFSFPREIPHLAAHLKIKDDIVKTHIDAGLQRFVKTLLYEGGNLPQGANAAILVHDHLHNQVISYVGSRDFFDQNTAGQVDFIQAVRSPGSTLKPLIYALAFDEGHITPETYFFDERKHFGAYAPRNFDHQHYGLVRGAESLQMSLNIPAVELLRKIGSIHFYGAMKSIDLNPRFNNAAVMPNLSMALGGVGMSLADLVTLYSCFAEGGLSSPLRFLKNDFSESPRYLVYPSSAEQLTKILKVNPLNRRGHLAHRNIALKTGTSYGYRDALALAYDNRYTIGVWVGMPQGNSLGPYTGLDLAVPFIEHLFKKLPMHHDVNDQAYENYIPETFKIKPSLKEYVFVKQSDLEQLPFKIQFPVSGSVLFQEKGKKQQIKLGGGKKPYRLFINGHLQEKKFLGDIVSWQPHSQGFYSLTAQDAEGHIASAEVEVQH